MPRKKKKEPYYGVNEEAAVVMFLESTSQPEREKIYRNHLQAPINKMIESIIRTYKLYRVTYEFNDLHADTLSFLMTKFDKFKPEKGNKSYSYFGTVCKHYLYGEMIKEHKKNSLVLDYDSVEEDVLKRDDMKYEIDADNFDLTTFIDDLTDELKDELDNPDITPNEFKVGHSLVKILEEWEDLFKVTNAKNSPKFNKNLILLYIRNMTGLNTKEIRNSMKRFRSLYTIFKNEYLED